MTTPSGRRALAVALLLALAPPPAAAQSDRAEARLLCEGTGGVPAARRLVACEWLLHADRENPLDLAWALNRRGGIRMQAGDHAGALADFDAALRQDPRQAAATFNRAMLLARMGRETEAEAAFGAATDNFRAGAITRSAFDEARTRFEAELVNYQHGMRAYRAALARVAGK